MRFIIPIGLVILLSSCGTTTNYYTQTVQSWQGANVKTLADRWGRPDNMIKGPRNQTIYVYKTESYHNTNAPTGPSAGISFSADGKPVIVTQANTNTTWNRGMSLTCNAYFIVNGSGTIVDTKISGDTCFGSSGFASRLGNPAKPVTEVKSS